MIITAFLNMVRKTDSCWLWIGSTNGRGYGNFHHGGRTVRAHRFSFELFRHDISDELVIDHLCQNKICVNPDHLDAVAQQVNVARYYASKSPKPICVNGHAMTLGDTYLHSNRRHCKECKRESTRRWRESLRVAA
jgi:hypothetical protein